MRPGLNRPGYPIRSAGVCSSRLASMRPGLNRPGYTLIRDPYTNAKSGASMRPGLNRPGYTVRMSWPSRFAAVASMRPGLNRPGYLALCRRHRGAPRSFNEANSVLRRKIAGVLQ